MSAGVLKVALVALNIPGYRSLALGYVRAHAEAHRRLRGRVAFQTLDLDTTVDPWWVAYRVATIEPDVVGFSVCVWNAGAVYEACRVLARVLPNARLVLGGPEVSPIAEQVLSDNPDVFGVVRGEGEETFADLLDAFARQRTPWRVSGVTCRRDGEIVSAPDRPLIEDLDTIPSPYLAGVLAAEHGSTYVETYRGCPHACAYCFEGKGYGRIRSFSQSRVAAEVDLIATTPGVREFSFVDPVFNLTTERLGWLLKILGPHAERGMRLHTVEVDVERVDGDVARLFRRCGVASVETGPQSVGAEALAACRRTFNEGLFTRGVRALNDVGIPVECDLIFGLPGDGIRDVCEGLAFLVALDPGRIQCSTLHVLPGTELWERSGEFGLAFDPQPPHCVIATASMSFQEIRRAELLGRAVQTEYAARL